MAVEIELSGGRNTIGSVIDYTVTEDATPLVAGDSSGSVGQIQVQAKANTRGRLIDRSTNVVGDDVTLSDDNSIDGTEVTGVGTITGFISSADLPGERVNFTAETLMARLNADRVAKPYFGSYVPPQTSVTTRTNLNSNPRRNSGLTNIAKIQPFGVNAISRATDDGYLGLPYARVIWTTTETGAGGGFSERTNGLTNGTSYTFSTYVRATRAIEPTLDAPVQRVRASLTYYSAANVAIGTPINADYQLNNGEWTRAVVAGVSPGATSYAILSIVSVTGTSFATWKVGDTFDSTASMTEQGGLNDWFDGSTATATTSDDLGRERVITYTWNGTSGESASTATIAITTPAYGYNATQANYFRYLCELVDLHNVQVDDVFENIAVAYPGWEGNVWKYMKDFAIAAQAEIALVNGTVTMRVPRTREIPSEQVANPVIAVSSALSSQYVEVYNYNSRWGTDESVWKSSTNYSVESDGYQSFEINIPHHITKVNRPIAIEKWNSNYNAGPGQYRVVDSQGVLVDPDWWNAHNGRVIVSLVPDKPTSLKVELFGPQVSSTVYVGPFKFVADDVNAGPALEITGSGVFIDKQVIRIKTGVSEAQTSVITGSTIDNVFLSTGSLAYDRGVGAACRAAGPNVTLTGIIAHSGLGGQQFGLLAGSRIKYRDNIFRLTDVRVSRKGISFTAENDMTFADATDLYAFTFGDVDALYAGLTFGQVDTLMAGLTFGEVDAQFPSATFESVDKIYEGLTFGEHAVYPYVKEPITDEAYAF